MGSWGGKDRTPSAPSERVPGTLSTIFLLLSTASRKAKFSHKKSYFLHRNFFFRIPFMKHFATFAQTLIQGSCCCFSVTSLTILSLLSYFKNFTLLSYFRQCKRGSTEASSHLEELVVEPPPDLRLLHGLGLFHPGEGTLLECYANHKKGREGRKR